MDLSKVYGGYPMAAAFHDEPPTSISKANSEQEDYATRSLLQKQPFVADGDVDDHHALDRKKRRCASEIPAASWLAGSSSSTTTTAENLDSIMEEDLFALLQEDASMAQLVHQHAATTIHEEAVSIRSWGDGWMADG